MTLSSHAIAVPCPSCGAPLQLDTEKGRATCGHCGTETVFEPDLIEQARRHLESIAVLRSTASQAAVEADLQRRRRRLGLGCLTPIFPLAIGLYVIFALGIGVASQFLVQPLLKPWLGENAAGGIGGIVAMVLWGALVALPLLLIARRRRVSLAIPSDAVGTSECPKCGAIVPVLLERHMVCPFCAAPLLRDAAAELMEKRALGQVASGERERANRLRRKADAAGARQVEGALGMVVKNQLMVIGFAVVLSILIVTAKLLGLF